MIKFPDQPDIRPYRPGYYRNDDIYVYEWTREDGVQCRALIPRGFVHDGNSNPRILWTLTGIRPDGLNRAGGLIHDAVFRWCGKMPVGWYQERRLLVDGRKWSRWTNVDITINRADANLLMRDINRAAKISNVRVEAMYVGVTAFSWRAWAKNKKRLKRFKFERELYRTKIR